MAGAQLKGDGLSYRNDAKTVNVITTACFSRVTKVRAASQQGDVNGPGGQEADLPPQSCCGCCGSPAALCASGCRGCNERLRHPQLPPASCFVVAVPIHGERLRVAEAVPVGPL